MSTPTAALPRPAAVRAPTAASLADAGRRAALRASALLGGVANPVLDRLTRVATRLLGVPVSLVSLVDVDRQHFPGLTGLGGWAGAERGTPLSHSFCRHVVASSAPLVVEHAPAHPLVHDNEAIADLGVVAYLGVPLTTADGHTLGALCAIDGAPRRWSAADHENLADLAVAVLAEIERHGVEARHRRTVEATLEVLYDVDPVTDRVTREGAVEALYGAPAAALTPQLEAWLDRVLPEDRARVAASWQAAIDDGRSRWSCEYRMQHDDGTIVIVQDRAHLLRDAQGRVERIAGAVNDVTVQRVAEEALRASEEQWRHLLEAAYEGICTVDATGMITYANPRLCEMLGYARHELSGEAIFAFMDSDAAQGAHERFARRRRGIAETRELAFRRRDGGALWVSKTVSSLYHADGTFVGALFLLTDITARREADAVRVEAERATREREADQRFLADFTAALQTSSDPGAIGALALARLVERFGVPIAGWTRHDLARDTCTICQEHAFGALRVDVATSPLASWAPDTAARLRAGEALAIADLGTDARITAERRASDAADGRRAMLAAPLVHDGTWVGTVALFDVVPRDWTAREVALLRAAVDRLWPALEMARALRAADQERRRLQAVLDALPVGVLITDAAGQMMTVTPEARRIWRAGAPDAPDAADGVGTLADYRRLPGFRRDTGAPLGADDWALTRALQAGEASTLEMELRPAGAPPLTLLCSSAPIRDGDGQVVGAAVVLSDLTERVRLEEQLRQAQKMEAVGQLAGGVAHDFNNLLTVITGNLEFVRGDLPPEHPVRPDLDEIRAAAERARALVRQLLTFSRKQRVQVQRVAVGALVTGAERLLRRVIGEEIVLAVHVADGGASDALAVQADPGQLEQVLMNLAVNARDAMLTARHGHAGRGGTLTIEVDALALGAVEARRWDGVAAGRWVRVVVRDTGHGMDAATQAHVFEPFFTTKDVGAGTGLGLATVFGIVRQCGGAIRVESAPGQGATFTILLPAAVSGEGSPTSESPATVPPTVGATVLLVEDEAPVRATARRMLERQGYAVLEARHGADALLAWEKHRAAIDVVVTDLRMPEMGGRELVTRLRADAPTLPVVFVSGYAEQWGAELPAHPRDAFVEKPFTGDMLLTAVTRLLQDDGATG